MFAMIRGFAQQRARTDIITEALDRAIGGAGWIVTPTDVAQYGPWNVSPDHWLRVLQAATDLANQIGAPYGHTFGVNEMGIALVARGYAPSGPVPTVATVTVPEVTPLPPGVAPVSPPIRLTVTPTPPPYTITPPVETTPIIAIEPEEEREAARSSALMIGAFAVGGLLLGMVLSRSGLRGLLGIPGKRVYYLWQGKGQKTAYVTNPMRWTFYEDLERQGHGTFHVVEAYDAKQAREIVEWGIEHPGGGVL